MVVGPRVSGLRLGSGFGGSGFRVFGMGFGVWDRGGR